jgi:hypothetical protein
MKEMRRTHLHAIPPVPAILGAIVSVQGGAALAKGLLSPAGPIGTVGLRVVLSAIMLMAVFRPRLRALSPGAVAGASVEWRIHSNKSRARETASRVHEGADGIHFATVRVQLVLGRVPVISP